MPRKRHALVRSRGPLVLTPYTRMVAFFAYAQPTEKWREWNKRTISQRQAQTLVAAGEAIAIEREKDGQVQVVGYRALKPTNWEKPSPTTLTFGDMVAVGNSVPRTRGDVLVHPDYLPTPAERRRWAKFKVWPLIGDTKAVAVRPRISDEDRRIALKLLNGPGHRGTGRKERPCRTGLRNAA